MMKGGQIEIFGARIYILLVLIFEYWEIIKFLLKGILHQKFEIEMED